MTAMNLPSPARPGTALLLSGGGARAAYQAGVLQGIAALQRRHGLPAGGAPFDIIVGTSAGAINAAALACGADHFQVAVARLAAFWSHFHVEQVYRATPRHALAASARWFALMLLGWLSPRWRGLQPHSLLDNAPLRALLQAQLPLDRLPGLLRQGHLRALAVTTSCYGSGEHVVFYDAVEQISDWARARRRAVRTPIGIEHLMASAAIPLLFPATRIEVNGQAAYYGDGSMRQMAPLAPAIHLGAQRLLVIAAGGMPEPRGRAPGAAPGHPSLAQIAGHALSSIFIDALAYDVERLQRLNRVAALMSDEARRAAPVRAVQALVIAPSRRPDEVALEHLEALPLAVRALLAAVGVHAYAAGAAPAASGAALASYVLFESSYTRALIALGEADTLARADEVRSFFGWPAAAPG